MNKATHEINETLLSLPPQLLAAQVSGQPALVAAKSETLAVPAEASAEIEQDMVTACYLCYGQCVNFGVEGIAGRPCARGVSAIVNRRRTARLNARAARLAGD